MHTLHEMLNITYLKLNELIVKSIFLRFGKSSKNYMSKILTMSKNRRTLSELRNGAQKLDCKYEFVCLLRADAVEMKTHFYVGSMLSVLHANAL